MMHFLSTVPARLGSTRLVFRYRDGVGHDQPEDGPLSAALCQVTFRPSTEMEQKKNPGTVEAQISCVEPSRAEPCWNGGGKKKKEKLGETRLCTHHTESQDQTPLRRSAYTDPAAPRW